MESIYHNWKYCKSNYCRPLGSYYPKHKDIYYSVNYGYIEDIFYRFDDVEEKWIVVPEDVLFTKEKIWQQVQFQEQYFNGIAILVAIRL